MMAAIYSVKHRFYVYLCRCLAAEWELHMNVDLIFKIAAVGILVAVLNLLLSNSKREEQALMTTIAGLVVVLIIIVQEINELFNMIKNLFGF